MRESMTLPAVNPDKGLTQFFAEIRAFPLLSVEEEYSLARRFHDDGDIDAAHKLVTSHLRLVAKIAMGYRGYGLPVNDLISEGTIGMMQAVKRFDPERGIRLATYAMWWIRASMQEYILHSWSLVKIGTTAAQKKLFFNLRRMKSLIRAEETGELSVESAEKISKALDIGEREVVEFNRRLAGPDLSLNAPMRQADTTGGGEMEWMDWLADDCEDQESRLAARDEHDYRQGLLNQAMEKVLDERERRIIAARRLSDEPATLDKLSQEFHVSRERIRQIERRAFEKIQAEMVANAS